MSTLNLIPHPEDKNIFYNIKHIVKIEKETYSIFWLTFKNGERIRFYDVDTINKVREFSDIEF